MSKTALPMQRLNLQLPKADVDFIKQLGYGSLSAGVRRALSIARRSPGLDLACDTDLESDADADADADSDVVGNPAPQAAKPAKAKSNTPTTSSAPVKAATKPVPPTKFKPAGREPQWSDYGPGDVIPLDVGDYMRARDAAALSDEGPIGDAMFTKAELAKARAEAAALERREKALLQAAQGQGTVNISKGVYDDANDEDDGDAYTYNPEDLPPSLR